MTLAEARALEVGSRIKWTVKGEEKWATKINIKDYNSSAELDRGWDGIKWDEGRFELIQWGADWWWENIAHYPCYAEVAEFTKAADLEWEYGL